MVLALSRPKWVRVTHHTSKFFATKKWAPLEINKVLGALSTMSAPPTLSFFIQLIKKNVHITCYLIPRQILSFPIINRPAFYGVAHRIDGHDCIIDHSTGATTYNVINVIYTV